jgi:hypothetical protein
MVVHAVRPQGTRPTSWDEQEHASSSAVERWQKKWTERKTTRAVCFTMEVSLPPVPLVIHNGRIWRAMETRWVRRLGRALPLLHDVRPWTPTCSTPQTDQQQPHRRDARGSAASSAARRQCRRHAGWKVIDLLREPR